MAMHEIPSIVVHNGTSSAPGSPSDDITPGVSVKNVESPSMEPSVVDEDIAGDDGGASHSENFHHSPTSQSSSLPVTPLSPSPTVSPSSLSGTGSPGPGTASPGVNSGNFKSLSPSRSVLPQGPGPGHSASFEVATMAVGSNDCGDGCVPLSSGGQGMMFRSKSLELGQHKVSEADKDAFINQNMGKQRYYHSSRLKLLQRSRALQEDSSPPPEVLVPPPNQGYPHGPTSNSLTVGPPSMGCPMGMQRRRLRPQGSSSQGSSFEGSSPCLSRDSSMEYTDSTGVDLLPFIIQTLHKNQKDRMLLLKIERELVNMVRDPKRTYHKFPHMSSYQRMLVHRVSAFFGMEHNVDQVGTCVIVNKTRNTRLPDHRFRDHIREELLPPDEPKRSILRRGYASFEDESSYNAIDRNLGYDSRRSKSFEEREEEYEKVRRRIFSDEMASEEAKNSYCMEEFGPYSRRDYDSFGSYGRRNSNEDNQWQELRPVDIDPNRKHFDSRGIRPFRRSKGESFEHDGLNHRSLRPPVFKSNSFGGYSGGITVLSRGNSVASNPSTRLMKQDSTGSRSFSDHSSSSGYKSQRQDTSSTNMSNHTMSTTPSPTAGHFQPHSQSHPSFGQTVGVWGAEGDCQPVMWAVTDMEAVPSGALLINPQNGQPYTNMDGSLYRYDPSNPPPMCKSAPSCPKMNSAPLCKDSPLQDMKCDSSDVDEGIDRASCNSKDGERDPNKSPFQPEETPGTSIDGRSYSEESNPDMSTQFRQMSLRDGSVDGAGTNLPHVTAGNPGHHQGYHITKNQQFNPTVYYVPATNIQSLPGGGVKYIYPQYPTNPTGAMGHASLPPTGMAPSHATGTPSIPNMPPPVIAANVSANPQNSALSETNPSHLTAGNYAMLNYPPPNLMTSPASATPGHEAGGTTYYYQMGQGIPPTMASGPPSAPGTGPVPVVTVAQYIPSSTTSSTTYPMAMGYYSASAMGTNPVYQSPPVGVQSYPGTVFGTPSVHQGIGPQPPPPLTQPGVPYRASTPPHSNSTQGVIPVGGYNSGATGVPSASGVAGNQYIAVLPTQPSASAPHPPQIYPTFYRPPLQAVWRGVMPGDPLDSQRRS